MRISIVGDLARAQMMIMPRLSDLNAIVLREAEKRPDFHCGAS